MKMRKTMDGVKLSHQRHVDPLSRQAETEVFYPCVIQIPLSVTTASVREGLWLTEG